MERNKIAQYAREMKTKEDLLKLLNRLKGAEMAELGYADSFLPFTLRQINFYCNPNNTFHRYKQFKVPKKIIGEFRTITAPRNNSFMEILHYVNEIFKSVYTPSKYAMGFCEGKSVVDNAQVHKDQNYVFNIDLKDFFPSIEQARVWRRLQIEPLNFPQPVANVLAGLCSMKESREMPDGTKNRVYVLPQGAPTSPILTNMICDRLDHRLAGVAKRFGLHYTRYADDITFSSMHNVYQSDGDFRKELMRIITDQGFTINEAKTRLQKKGSRQEVTGIILSDKLNVTQKYVRDIRNILYIWQKYGIGTAELKFSPKYKQEKGHVKKGNPDLINVLDGKLMYLKMVKGETDSVYVRLHSKFIELKDSTNDKTNVTEHGITYFETQTIAEFETKHSTVISIVNEEKARYGTFVLGNKTVRVSINKNLDAANIDKNKMVISCCKDTMGQLFWLIHRKQSTVSHFAMPVDIDSLNNDLDSLLSD